MLTNLQLVAYCEKAYSAGWVYWYGTYGNPCTLSKYQSKKSQYPTHYTADRTAQYMRHIDEGRICADCVGLIKSFFWANGVFGASPKYGANHCPDTSANGMIGICKQTGPIATIPDIPGLVVWKSGHIGVYVGGGYTVEMRGFKYGSVRRKVKDGPWTKWGRLPDYMMAYVSGEAQTPAPEPAEAPEPVKPATISDIRRILKRGSAGEDVRILQAALIDLGYSCGGYGADGDFGQQTETALRRFQADQGLDADGEFGPLTLAAMLSEQAREAEPAIGVVEVTGASVNVRAAPNTGGRILGVVHRGDKLPYQGQDSPDGWHLVIFGGENGWISGKYSEKR